MATLLHLDIVTPEKQVLSAPVEMVVVPGMMGDMGIMAEHAPILSLLRAGTIEVHQDGRITQRWFVAGGYVEVHDNHCTVLAEHLMDAAALTTSAVNDEIARLNTALAASSDEIEKARLQNELTAAQAKLQIAA